MNSATVVASNGEAPYQVNLDDGRHQWRADEPQEAGGGDTGPNPMQLLCSSLATCTAITVRMYAERKGWPLQGLRVEVTMNPEGSRAGEATVLKRTLSFSGGLDQAQKERLLQIANACPVHKILSGTISIPTGEG